MDLGSDGEDLDRRQFLDRCAILDTPRETAFDRILFTLAQVTRSRMAVLAFIDDRRVWAKSHVGHTMKQRPRDRSLSQPASQIEGGVVLEDTFEDRRFADRAPLETGEVVRGLLMVPLTGPSSEVIGVLGAMSGYPRRFSGRELGVAQQLAREVRELLLLRVPGLDVSRL